MLRCLSWLKSWLHLNKKLEAQNRFYKQTNINALQKQELSNQMLKSIN
jgi:hypothetical protein